MKLRLAFLLSSILLVAAEPAKEEAKKAPVTINGTWTPTKLIYNGKDMTNNKKTQFKFVFKDNEAVVEGSKDIKKEYARLKVKLEPSYQPALIDMTVGGGVQTGVVMEGIYELKGDELKICAKVFGSDRPNEFSSPAGSSIVLLVLKRTGP